MKKPRSKEELIAETKAKEEEAKVVAENKRLRTLARERLFPLLQTLGDPLEVIRLTDWISVLTQQAHMKMVTRLKFHELDILEGLPEENPDVPKLRALVELVKDEGVHVAITLIDGAGKEIKSAREQKAPNKWDEIEIKVLDDPKED